MRWDKTKGVAEPVLALDKIILEENREPLVDLRIIAPRVRIVRPQTIPWCRQSVAEMVAKAASSLPAGYYLGVTDAWRPIQRQMRIYEFMTSSAKEAYPKRGHASIRRTVNRWVAPPYRQAPPGHCTGAALDVNLLDEAGETLDVWSPFERFKAAPTYTLGLSEVPQRQRTMLVEAMLGAGFSNCRDEWWHYSWGDAGWAVRMGKKLCVYGVVELEASSYEEQERLWLEDQKERTNPFL